MTIYVVAIKFGRFVVSTCCGDQTYERNSVVDYIEASDEYEALIIYKDAVLNKGYIPKDSIGDEMLDNGTDYLEYTHVSEFIKAATIGRIVTLDTESKQDRVEVTVRPVEDIVMNIYNV